MGASERPVFISVGQETKPPIGWRQFCTDNPRDCEAQDGSARDVVLNAKDLERSHSHQSLDQ